MHSRRWLKAFAEREHHPGLQAAIRILWRTGIVGLMATIVTAIDQSQHWPDLGIDITPYEIVGVVLGMLLVLRTNAGMDRWWEARKLWGAIVNSSRNLAIAGLTYGPEDRAWRERFVRHVIAFAHVARRSLRGERELPEVAALLGDEEARRIAAAAHMPNDVSHRIAADLRLARDTLGLDDFAFLQADRERAALIDDIGGCERILKTPLPRAYDLQFHGFIFLFLFTLPFGLLPKVFWLTPLETSLAALSIFSLDVLCTELQNPFCTRKLSHLPLDSICATIESNLLALLEAESQVAAEALDGRAPHGPARVESSRPPHGEASHAG